MDGARSLHQIAETGCDVCGSSDARELYKARDRLRNSDEMFAIVRCESCGVLRTLPVMTENELASYYPAEYWGSSSEPSTFWIHESQKEKTRFLERCGLRGGAILDVGCGSGFFLRALDGRNWRRLGIDSSREAIETAQKELNGGAMLGSLFDARLPESSIDVVTFWSALEHTNNPRETLIETRRILKTGASVILQVPNAASYQARIFKQHWFALDAPRHRYHFTHATLERLLQQTGFLIYRVTFFSTSHNFHSLKQSLKTSLFSSSPSVGARAVIGLAMPLLRPLDVAMAALGRGATITLAARAI